MRALYRSWESFVANSTLQIFGTQDYGSADYISRLLGQATQRTTSRGSTSSDGYAARQARNTQSESEGSMARALLTADEVCRLPKDTVIVRTASSYPQKLRRLNYLKDPRVSDRAAPNPMFE
jgi:type IV secretory pathway TraG/TraD family ATPase VirD4